MQCDNPPQDTINHLFDASYHTHGNRPAIGMAFEKPLTFIEFWEKVVQLAIILSEMGIKKGDAIAILAENSPQWGIAYLAIVRLGAIAVPILPDFTESDVTHILNDAKIRVLFTTVRQLEKIYDMRDGAIEKIITLDDCQPETSPCELNTLSQIMSEKSLTTPHRVKNICDIAAGVEPDDIASIIYTSGTSGHSKAAMISHRNLVANVKSASQVIDIPLNWTFLSILPMSHTYEFTIGFLLPLYRGVRIIYAGARPTPSVLEKVCRHEKPSVICIVPMVMEKIYKKKILPALSRSRLLNLATKIPLVRKQIMKKIGRKLGAFFGGRLELVAIGGAPILHEVEHFLRHADFPYLVGYGMTEASPLISGGPFKDTSIAVGSAGKPVPGVEVKIMHPDPKTGIGEIYARGPNIMQGYYNNPELTAQTIDVDGWLASGDMGFLDDQNNLHIKGRSKSVIVLSHGENIYPEAIEDMINTFPFVSESLVLDRSDKLEAHIYPDYDFVDQQTKGGSHAERIAFINQHLLLIKKEVNDRLPKYAQISAVKERQEPFAKTATHKIKRYLYN